MGVVRLMEAALASSGSPEELRDELLNVFILALAESDGHSGRWWTGARLVIGDIELALLGWGGPVPSPFAAMAFEAAAHTLTTPTHPAQLA